MDVDKLESLVSRAEIAYKSGKIMQAVKYAKKALCECSEYPRKIALQIFIARCYSKLGKYSESNVIYRGLLCEKVYIAPVIFGIFYNNFESKQTKKMKLNLTLVKSCLLLQ